MLKGQIPFIFEIIAIIGLIVIIAANHSISLVDIIIVFFAGLAIILSLGQFVIESAKEDAIYANYKSALKKFKPSENEKPILKALIKMKPKHTKFTLAEIRTISPELFTKEKLLEKLYE